MFGEQKRGGGRLISVRCCPVSMLQPGGVPFAKRPRRAQIYPPHFRRIAHGPYRLGSVSADRPLRLRPLSFRRSPIDKRRCRWGILVLHPKPKWRNGRRGGLKNLWGQPRGGSSPPFGTHNENSRLRNETAVFAFARLLNEHRASILRDRRRKAGCGRRGGSLAPANSLESAARQPVRCWEYRGPQQALNLIRPAAPGG